MRNVRLRSTSRSEESSKAADTDSMFSWLGAFSNHLLLIGELTAFVGILMAIVALVIWPDNPENLEQLKGEIYFPESLAKEFYFIHSEQNKFFIFNDIMPIAFRNSAMPFLAMMGLYAILRRRWVLTGLFFATLLFPLPTIGYSFSQRIMFLGVFGLVFLLRELPFPLYVRIALIPVVLFFYRPILKVVTGPIFEIINYEGFPHQPYRYATFNDLLNNEGKTATLIGMLASPRDTAGYAYALAQEHALRGNMKEAVQHLDEAEKEGFVHSPLNDRRIEDIRNYAATTGVLGLAEKEAVYERYEKHKLIPTIVLVIGIFLGLVGPLAYFTRNELLKRAYRIRDMLGRLSNPGQDTGAQLSENEDEVSRSEQAFSGHEVIAKASQRTHIFSAAAFGFAILAFVAAYGSHLFWLPSADLNTGFNRVGLLGETKRLVEQSGVEVIANNSATGFFWHDFIPYELQGVAVLLLSLILFRKHWRIILSCMLILFFALYARTLVPNLSSMFEVAAEDIFPDVRKSFQTWAAPLADKKNVVHSNAPKVVEKPLKPSSTRAPFSKIGSTIAGEVALRASMADVSGSSLSPKLRLQQSQEVSLQERLNAAYALAQIAYIEDQPDDAFKFVTYLVNAGMPQSEVHLRRIALVIGWVDARGHPLSKFKPKSQMQSLIDTPRWIGHVLYWFAICCALLACLAITFGIIAEYRRHRILVLVKQKLEVQHH